MRLGVAVLAAAAVMGGYALVNHVASRPAMPGEEAAEERGWLPGVIEDEPAPEGRRYELIRYVNKDGSFGMVDDPTRVPKGATIVGRERKTVAAPKPSAAEPAPSGAPMERAPDGDHRLSEAEQNLLEKVLETGVFPDANQLDGMQGELDAVEQERRAAAAGEDAAGVDEEWGKYPR
jgi:hypothetical protein